MRIIGNAPVDGEVRAVASGALANGDTVIVNADGTVTKTQINPDSFGTATQFDTSGNEVCATFDSFNNKVVVAYKNSAGSGVSSGIGYAVVGTVSGTSISFGTPVVFDSDTQDNYAIVFDSNSNKVVIFWRGRYQNSVYACKAIVGTVSGTSISFGSSVTFVSFSGNTILFPAPVFDTNSNKVVLAYRDGTNSNYGTAIVGTVSGTSISFGSGVVFNTNTSGYMGSTFDSSNNKVVIAYQNSGNGFRGTAIVGTVSGTSISFGSATAFNNGNTQDMSCTFDSNSNKVVVAYRDNGNGNIGAAIVGTVSGTSISFGSEVELDGSDSYYLSATFDSNSNKVVIAWKNITSSNKGSVIVGTVSGTSISFGSSLFFSDVNTSEVGTTFDSNSNKVVLAYRVSSGNYGYGVILIPSSTNLTSENFIGFSDAAYADTQTATIEVGSAVNNGQSSLTIGQQYFVQEDGTIGTTAADPSVIAGTAISTTEIIVKG